MSKNLIAISGKAGSGKNTVASMLQELNCNFQEKAFAGKLKEIASMLTGIPVHKFEDQEFKKTNLNAEWNMWSPVFLSNDERYGVYFTEEEAIKADKENHYVYQWWTNALKTEVREFPMTVREFLQKLGTDGLRDGLHTNVWVNALFADYHEKYDVARTEDDGSIAVYPDTCNWIITDCRFPNEAHAVKQRSGIVIRIEKEGLSTMDHPSETSLDDYEFDHVIYNNGSLSELRNKVIEMYESIIV